MKSDKINKRTGELEKRYKDKLLRRILEGKTLNQIAKEFKCTRNTIWNHTQWDDDMKAKVAKARKDSALFLAEDAIEVLLDDKKDLLECPVTGKYVMNTTKTKRDEMKHNGLMRMAAIQDSKYSKNQNLDITSKGESVSGFCGLIITPPKDPEEEDNDDSGNDNDGQE